MAKSFCLALLFQLVTVSYALGGVVELSKTGQTLCYDLAGNVISCTGTGQDGETQSGLPWPSPRFSDNLDGSVTDNLTGLIWLKNAVCPDVQLTGGSDWSTALAAANGLHSGQCGLTDGSVSGDWRLPNASEMESLVDISKGYPSLTTGYPFATVHGQVFWTSTTYPLYSHNAESVSIGNGCLRADVKDQLKLVWPVKGASTKIAKTGQTTCWDIYGAVMACAGSGQDGDKQAGVAWPAPRFVDSGDGTLVDQLTHLVWLKNSNCFGQQDSQDSAIAAARVLASGVCGLTDGSAQGDWRLPNRNEMRSLVNYQAADGGVWLNSQGFTNTVYSYFWTSDSYALGIDQSWFPAGANPALGDKWMVNTNGSVWLSSWVSNYVDPFYKYMHPVRGPYDAYCGSANGGTFSTAPTTNLCSTGTASAVAGTGPWNWTCSISQAPSITVNCSAKYAGTGSPAISLTAPSNGATFTAPANVAISATATAGTGTSVSKVDFYNGSTLLGTVTTTPYTFIWSNVAAGNYSLTAKVTNTLGATATSASTAITVNPAPVAPTVRITAPASGTTYTAPATVPLSASATPGGGATIKQVDFYVGSTLLGSTTVSPYSYIWSNVPAGGYSLSAKVTDTLGATATSSAVTITITQPALPPSVAVTAPAAGSTFNAPATFTISATATPGTGASVKQVAFYSGSTLLGTSTVSPYSYTLNNAPAGNYSLTAKVTDTLGGTATSTPVAITVNVPPVAATATVTAPTNGALYTAPATVTISAIATPSSGAAVKQVAIYNGGTLLGTSNASPYTITWKTGAAGTYSFTAKVTDTLGATATSSAVSVTIRKKK